MTLPKPSDYRESPSPKRQLYVPVRGALAPTGEDIPGPFWLPDSPLRTNVCPEGVEPTLALYGRVLNEDGEPIVGALLDFWQADAMGNYDRTGPNFRGHQWSGSQGHYLLESVKPGAYDISDPSDPQPHLFRCAHIHCKASFDGYEPLTTQFYFSDDPLDATDEWYQNSHGELRCLIAERGTGRYHFDIVLRRK